MNIVVLCGGTSTERDVSLVTGEQVCRALRNNGHKTNVLDVFIGHEGMSVDKFFSSEYSIDEELTYIKENAKDLKEQIKNRKEFFGFEVLELCKNSDIVFMALHGANGEDGRVQAAFDLMGIKYTGSDYISSAMAMSKAVTKQVFKAENVPMANSFALKKGMEIKDVIEYGVKYPCVVKPNCGGSSIGVYFADNFEEYKKALEGAFLYEDEVLVEDRIVGREFSVGVIGYEPLPVIEIIPKVGFYDYENKYKAGATVEECPANLSPEITKKMQEAAYLAAKALGLSTYCRVDVLLDNEDNCYCLEANTLPGMTPTSLLPQEASVVGMDFVGLCEKIIEVSK